MLARSMPLAARLYAGAYQADRPRECGSSLRNHRAKEREGTLDLGHGGHDKKVRQALHAFSTEPEDRRRLTKLPGVEFESELPADPITRIFFQRKGDYALHQGTYDHPALTDPDRIEIAKRETKRTHFNNIVLRATYDFCHRLREASEQRKRFVIVPATSETKGIAKVLQRHGLVNGFRDFHNDRAFAIELKYFQNESVLNGIEPVSSDAAVEYDWSPKMVRRQLTSYGITNKIRIYVLRTWDGRVIDHVEAAKEGLGGRGLVMAF